MSDLPRRTSSRTARLASLPLGYAGRSAMGVGRRLAGVPAEQVATEVRLRTAEQVFTVLGSLKGGAMKFGQALSVLEAAMPEEVAGDYRAMLTKLQDSAPPMGTSRVHAILADQLGKHWRTECFNDFDDVPAAAASIGQVHRATWRDGRPVAVKIQYPGAGDALRSDLAQIARLGRLIGVMAPGLDVKPITEELAARMVEELDYRREARTQSAFAAAFVDDEHYAVPDVVAHTATVLVTEWLDGVPLSRIAAEGSEAVRDAAAQLYHDFLLVAPERAHLLHADPHPGNFRITPDGRLGVLDFGAVNHLPEGLPTAMGTLIRAAVEGEADTVLAGLRAEGFVKPTITLDADEVLGYLAPFLTPLEVERHHFTREWLRSVTAPLQDPRSPAFAIGLRLNLPPRYMLIHRVWSGGVGVLAQLGGHVTVRDSMERHLPGFAEH
ncbi:MULTISPECIES: ABC1 kinase family protein [unclassified Janibacter]|uniref:ABC1 kinase family protein n=1 Tax=unclassified Janibacter TaxID=2649294 RepID=UPI003D08C56D